jgi:hypothetical protein
VYGDIVVCIVVVIEIGSQIDSGSGMSSLAAGTPAPKTPALSQAIRFTISAPYLTVGFAKIPTYGNDRTGR